MANVDYHGVAQSLLVALQASGDLRLASFCAEYLVADKIRQSGHEAIVLQKKRGPDILLKDLEKCVEVKSSHTGLPEWDCGASFYSGSSIKNRDFAYCVFVIFRNLKPNEYLIFTVEELKEVAEKPRPYPITAYPNNSCVLFRYNRLDEYQENMKGNTLDIEVELHSHPDRFNDRWDKIT